MRRAFESRAGTAAVAATVALLLAGGGYAIAATGGSIHACAKKSGGALRLAGKGKKSERGLSWNIQGPAGQRDPQGPRGPQGALGAQGRTGSAGASGATNVVMQP